jgi:hypothetical protein
VSILNGKGRRIDNVTVYRAALPEGVTGREYQRQQEPSSETYAPSERRKKSGADRMWHLHGSNLAMRRMNGR